MRVIDRIANLILDDPYITAVQIARQLGYAEQKTVYYWIQKSRFQGLTAFKRAVLSGQYHPPQPNEELREHHAHYGRFDIAETFLAHGEPLFTGETMSLSALSGALFIWRYPGPATPSILPQDLLVLGAFQSPSKLPWAVGLGHLGQMEPRLMTYHQNQVTALYPLTLSQDVDFHPLYNVLELVRTFAR